MDQATAFKATFHNLRVIMGRKMLQVVLEVPIEDGSKVTDILGWPDPTNSKWVAVALLNEDANGI